MEIFHDPLYQWYSGQLKALRIEFDRLNRRDPRREEIRLMIKDLKLKKAAMRDGRDPQMIEYGLF